MIKLQELRIEKNLSQNEVAKNLGITQQAYSRYEREERELGYDLLKKFANFFDVSVDYLLNNSTYFYPDKVNNLSLDLTKKEETLLRYFRSLSSELQEAAIETTRVLAGVPADGLQKKA